jgi:hypothetical protein
MWAFKAVLDDEVNTRHTGHDPSSSPLPMEVPGTVVDATAAGPASWPALLAVGVSAALEPWCSDNDLIICADDLSIAILTDS